MKIEWFKSKIGESITYQTPYSQRITVEITEENYHILYGMQSLGYDFSNYKEVIVDFELPEIETKKSNNPRVHISDNACTSCEG